MPNFTVDTHLFRELGELLVGRASTALIELIKNSYDADATDVVVHGERLPETKHAKIAITDNGNGMGPEEFNDGFLRVASRLKEEGDRRSEYFKRRYTGAKGVGRLAAHKLARHLTVESVPRDKNKKSIVASIDWDIVESCRTLDEVGQSGAISIESAERKPGAKCGTTITLTRLRREWTPAERTKFFQEVETFRTPELLLNSPAWLTGGETILGNIEPSDIAASKDRVDAKRFDVELTGDFAAGEDYWQAVGEAADWVIEIDASDKKIVRYVVMPTNRVREELAAKGIKVRSREASQPHPNSKTGPFFQARIFLREGQIGRKVRTWASQQSGVRVFVEGFRVLPYGEPSDDWLALDSDYVQRDRTLSLLDSLVGGPREEEDEGLTRAQKQNYIGAVFLTQNGARDLQMLVNREGFVPNQAYSDLVQIVRTGINFSVRVRAAFRAPLRQQRSNERRTGSEDTRLELKAAVEQAVEKSRTLATEARTLAAQGQYERATELIVEASQQFEKGAETSDRLVTERETMQVLASLGLHMAAFVHEVRGLLSLTQTLDRQLERLRTSVQLDEKQRKLIGEVSASVSELRRVVERQAANLTEITSPDARRRRSRLNLAERFDTAMRLLGPQSERRGITVDNRIPRDLKTPPMFPAELMLVLANLLSNAIKAAGDSGRVIASGRVEGDGSTLFRLENTGVSVDLKDAEKWFLPFESSTATADPTLGQGMGMGLTITRNLLEEYGASVAFAAPTRGYATAIQIRFAH